MRYLILGSSGQIGSALCEYYKNKGHTVDEFDIVNGKHQDLRIDKSSFLYDKISKSDFVFFLAFDVGGSRYLKKYEKTFDFIQNNMKIMLNTFECLQSTQKPFIFSSSQMSDMNFSPYGTLKRIGEYYTEALDGLSVKFWNIYGTEQDFDKSHVITDFILKAKNTGTIDMITDGSEMRQLLHVDDCCKCLDILAENYDSIDKKKNYHVSSFKWNTILEVAEMVASNFDNITISPSETKDTVQQDKRYEPDKHILNYWKPTIPLSDGIKSILGSINCVRH
jgi:nucleoside-diphosphate-sugar epimerase